MNNNSNNTNLMHKLLVNKDPFWDLTPYKQL